MKKKLLLTMLLSGVLAFTSCTTLKIADTNGADDYSLNTLTEKELIASSTSSYSIGSVSSSTYTSCSVQMNEFHGVKSIFTYVVGTAREFTVTNEVTSGNLLVFVLKDEKIIKEFEVNGTEVYTRDTDSGYIDFRIAGESAKFKVTITVA